MYHYLMYNYLNCSLNSYLVYISTFALWEEWDYSDNFEESAKDYTSTITSKVCSEKQHAF